MTDFMLALTLMTGIVTAQSLILKKNQADLRRFDDQEDGESEPPRLDHAAPGRGRTPLAFCMIIAEARLTDAMEGEFPCN